MALALWYVLRMKGPEKPPPPPAPPPPPVTPAKQKRFIQDRVPDLFDQIPAPPVQPEDVRFILSSKLSLNGPQVASIQGRRLDDRLERSKIRYAIEKRSDVLAASGVTPPHKAGKPDPLSHGGGVILTSRIKKPTHRRPDWALYDADADKLTPKKPEHAPPGVVLTSAVHRPGSEVPQRLPQPRTPEETPRKVKSRNLSAYLASPEYAHRMEEANTSPKKYQVKHA